MMEEQVIKYVVTGSGDLAFRDTFLERYVGNTNKFSLINNVFSKKINKTDQRQLQFDFLNSDLESILNQQIDDTSSSTAIQGLIFIYDQDVIKINIPQLEDLFNILGKSKDNILFVINQSFITNNFEEIKSLLELFMKENISQIYYQENQIGINTIKQIDKWIINRKYEDNLTLAYQALQPLQQNKSEQGTLIVFKNNNNNQKSEIRENHQQCNLI
ncbi:hypothetical protein ABPG74_022013 [Tetrahymena malaccensis]